MSRRIAHENAVNLQCQNKSFSLEEIAFRIHKKGKLIKHILEQRIRTSEILVCHST